MKYLKTTLLLLYVIHNSYIVNNINKVKMTYTLDSTLDVHSLDSIVNAVILSNIFVNVLLFIGIF